MIASLGTSGAAKPGPLDDAADSAAALISRDKAAAGSDATDEPPRIQDTARIEPLLERLHDGQARRLAPPERQVLLGHHRAAQHDRVAPAPHQLGLERPQRPGEYGLWAVLGLADAHVNYTRTRVGHLQDAQRHLFAHLRDV